MKKFFTENYMVPEKIPQSVNEEEDEDELDFLKFDDL